jgi:hypothetical protein
MAEKIIPIPKSSLEKLLRPVSRMTESCVLKISDNKLYTISTPSHNSFFLYAKTDLPVDIEDTKLNIINIKKFLTGLACLGNDGEFSLKINENNIECGMCSADTKENTIFKYHLVNDGIIKEAGLNVKKIASLEFDTEFTISQEKVKKIITAYSFVSDVSKIYFYSTDDGKINCEINDKTMQNVDNLSMSLADDLIGEQIRVPIPVNIEIFKNLITSKSNIRVRLNNSCKIFVFQSMEQEDVELKYIISALVK